MENVPRRSSKYCWCLQGILRQQSVEKRKDKGKNTNENKLSSLQISGPQSIKENEVLNGCILNMNIG